MTNLEKIQNAFDQWITSNGQDSHAWFSLFADDITFVFMGGNNLEPLAGRAQTRKLALRAHFEGIRQEMDMLDYTVTSIVEKDDLVVSIGKSVWRIRATGRVFRSTMIKMFWFDDGKIIRLENCFDSAALREARGRTAHLRAVPPPRPVPMDRG